MHSFCSGVILAGGLSSRFSGANKAFIEIGNKRIIDRIYDVFSGLFEEIILVTNDLERYLDWNMKIVTDIHSTRSSLTGIHAGLFYAAGSHAFITACDTPFIKKDIIEAVVLAAQPQTDVVVPETSAGIEPLCAVYSKRCLKHIENQLQKKEYKIQKFFNKIRVVKIPENELKLKDPELNSFFNVNNPSSLEKAIEMGKR